MASDCNHVLARGGRTWAQPCGESGVCSPDDVSAWNEAAASWAAAAEAESLTPEQHAWAADMRRRYTELNTDIPAPWSLADRVNDYVLLCQQYSCALVPLWEERRRVAEETGGDWGNGGGTGGGGGTGNGGTGTGGTPEDDGWSFPELPGWPGWPSLPGWPSFSWPSIPDWAWWVAGGIVVLYLWPKGDR